MTDDTSQPVASIEDRGVPGPGQPQVSVVIPTRNRWPLLRRALTTALDQQGVTVEVLVVDEASEDETPQRLAEIADPRVRSFRHSRARGVAGARNRGIQEAGGEWTAFLDDDDLWSPQKLRTQLDAALAAGADYVYGAALQLSEDHRVQRAIPAPPPAGVAERLARFNVIPAGASNVMARTRLLRDLGGFDERLHQIADWDMWLRLATGRQGAAVAEAHVGYVQHDGTMRVSGKQALLAEFAYFQQKHRDACDIPGFAPDGLSFARWMAWGYLRSGSRRTAADIYLRSAIAQRSIGNALSALGALLGGRVGERMVRTVNREAQYETNAFTPTWLTEEAP